MIYLCGQSNRSELVLATAGLNGIDYLEVTGPPGCGTELAITFLKDATGLALTPANVVVTGDTAVSVTGVAAATAQATRVVTVQLDQTGDFAPYTLRLAAVQVAADGTVTATPDPPDGLDPVLSTVTFSFKAGCPSPADCLPASTATPAPPAPDINYLARDYDGFRQVMLDRLAVLAPAWTERHAADLGIVLVEALAYAADHLSYQQDAVGTEAYLGTARSRISLRRHARLVDYRVGEGCNARALVAVDATADGLTLPSGTLFYPAVPGLPVAGVADGPLAAPAIRDGTGLRRHPARVSRHRAGRDHLLHLGRRELLPARRGDHGHPDRKPDKPGAGHHPYLRGEARTGYRSCGGCRPGAPLRGHAHRRPVDEPHRARRSRTR